MGNPKVRKDRSPYLRSRQTFKLRRQSGRIRDQLRLAASGVVPLSFGLPKLPMQTKQALSHRIEVHRRSRGILPVEGIK